jgi:glycine dehydrogenase
MNINRISGSEISLSFDELSTDADLSKIYQILNLKTSEKSVQIASGRQSKYLTHPMFNSYHSETSMLRYIRSLSDRDLALDRTMIPLGSCTMKLNATSEMIPVTWPQFANIHPFAPLDQSKGYKKMIDQLSKWLVEVTGYDAVSLQPNAGSQGEFAGLLAIRNYLDNKGEQHRNICLIPSSAHGTNAASAVMAGMKVVVIECDELGNVSIADIKAKIEQYQDQLAALMVTYPSTHGVFEEAISDICQLIHEAGGQVYVDGANLNALVGLAKPGKFGADVSHLNLHKTFCIPHGGGGPGVGPVIARAHLAPFLPNHPADSQAGPITGPGAVSSAPYGSASILPISWMYIRMMGGAGLTKATQTAILSANYIAKKLDPFFPILYKGKNDLIAHECIIDIREITKATGVTVDDIAKRLMDHGFHAPTVSFPVAGTMMIEPTESEDLRELDRFIAALESIHQEITDISQGRISIEDSPLRHAPHTMGDLVRDDWDRKYARSKAAFPRGENHGIGASGKYLPTVGRIDGVHGDRNLICSCVPIEELAIN